MSREINGRTVEGSTDNLIDFLGPYMPQEIRRILVTVQFIEKSAVYNQQNYQWSEYRGIQYAEAERFEYSSQGFSD